MLPPNSWGVATTKAALASLGGATLQAGGLATYTCGAVSAPHTSFMHDHVLLNALFVCSSVCLPLSYKRRVKIAQRHLTQELWLPQRCSPKYFGFVLYHLTLGALLVYHSRSPAQEW